ncbi:MAG: erythronate-4-phosphate dehydrogenase [Pseudohongiellaceae bacterium]|jgi:erythronate-4-phosphate dehydrogenase
MYAAYFMKIIADANLKDIEIYFSQFGQLQLIPGREINTRALADADALLIRSVTKVDRALLESSKIKFVGTATSGTDHVDQTYLSNNGVFFAHARGSNAQAVADYCLSAFLKFSKIIEPKAKKSRIGIIGLGAVGSALARLLKAIGLDVLAYDPLLTKKQRQHAISLGVEFTTVIEDVFDLEAISIHTPLSFGGKHPTSNMVGQALLERLPNAAVLINASRGEVIKESELLAFLERRSDVFAVLDVWDNEPELNLDLMALATIATPHIAGYSRRAKTLATNMLAEAFAKFLHGEAGLFSRPDEPSPENLVLKNKPASVENFVSCALPIEDWSAEFKLKILKSSDRGDAFDKFRKSMINRAEFSDFEIDTFHLDHREVLTLKKLGFNLR